MTGDSSCGCCGYPLESLVHILRDCIITKDLWLSIVKPSSHQSFFNLDLNEWLKLNIVKPHLFGGDNWGSVFASLCWLIWQRRNTRIFERKVVNNATLLLKTNSLIYNLSRASKKLQGINLNGCTVLDRFSRWSPPLPGWFKLNIDGAFFPQDGAGCGGIVRDCSSSFHGGFMCKTVAVDCLVA